MKSKTHLLPAGLACGCAACASTACASTWRSPEAQALDPRGCRVPVVFISSEESEKATITLERDEALWVGASRAVNSNNREKFVATLAHLVTKQVTRRGALAVTFEAAP